MKYCSFDFETTGLSPFKGAVPFSYCIGHEDGRVGVYRLDGKDKLKNTLRLQRFWQDTSRAKICHNLKFELHFLKVLGIDIPEKTELHDTMIMSQLLRNDAVSHALDNLFWEMGGDESGKMKELDKKVERMGKAYGGYYKVPEYLMRQYQINDGVRTMLLFQLWIDDIKSNHRLYDDYRNEIELIKTTQRLEEYGINISPRHAKRLIDWMKDELDKVQNECFKMFGEYINLNSGDQVARVLYKKLKFPILEFTDSGKPATGKEVILELQKKFQHSILDLILRQRSYTKGIAIVNGYLDHAVNGIIHPNIKTNHARTGRESSSDPNLQNVSKDAVLKNPYPVPARQCFICRRDHVLFFVDYSGIEMRLIIDTAEEESLIQLLKDGGDPHALAAELFYGDRFTKEKDPSIKKVLRSASKNASFGKAYGAGLGSVAAALNLTTLEAEPGYKEYGRKLPKIFNFTNNISRIVREQGYIETAFGRKLNVSIDKAYIGANYVIQGTAAGILKRAQVRVDKYLKEKWGDQIRLVLPIHDELVISYPRDLLVEKNKILNDISEIMTSIDEIKVPLEVEWKITTTTWDKAYDITL